MLGPMNCVWCDKEFVPLPRSKPRAKFCSQRCRQAEWESRREREHTGFCAFCRVEVASPKKFCSAECRNASMRTGRAMSEVVCEFCGKTVSIPSNDGRRQRFCSRNCSAKGTAREAPTNDIPEAFGNWLAGFTDGEGSFNLVLTRHGNIVPRFAISLRRDDRAVLSEIHETLGFGRIYDTKRFESSVRNNNPKSSFCCHSVRECRALVDVFDRFPLRAKKATDFAIWREAVILSASADCPNNVLISLSDTLKSVRRYSR